MRRSNYATRSIKARSWGRGCRSRDQRSIRGRHSLWLAVEITPFGQGTGIPSWQNSQNINSPWLARGGRARPSHYGTDWIKIYETEDYEGSGYPKPYGAGAFMPDGKMINVPSLTLEKTRRLSTKRTAEV